MTAAAETLTPPAGKKPRKPRSRQRVDDLPVRIGYPQGVGGRIEDIRSPRCTTGVGLVLYGSKAKTYVPKERGGVFSRFRGWVKNIV